MKNRKARGVRRKGKIIWPISELVDRIFHENLLRARKEIQIAPQASAGYGFPLTSLLAFRKAQRGREKKTSMSRKKTPATAKERDAPHDCKQYEFPSGTLEPPDISNMPALGFSMNLEMTQKSLTLLRLAIRLASRTQNDDCGLAVTP